MPPNSVTTAAAPAQGARVRLNAPLGAVRRDLSEHRTLPAGTVGVMCGPWPHPITDGPQVRKEGWLLVVVDDEDGAWHVPVEPRMVTEVVDQ